MNNKDEVAKLLEMYDEYKNIAEDISKIESKIAKNKILNKEDKTLEVELENNKFKLQKISDEMTFDNPLIWIEYKYKAYKNESQPIETLRDLRNHCSKEGYICTKRFDFLNKSLKENGELDLLNNPNLQPDDDLSKILKLASIENLTNNPSFMAKWREFEYNKSKEGRVAKWENYK